MHLPNTDRAAELATAAYEARRAARPAWRNEHLDRQAREREAYRLAKEQRAAAHMKDCRDCGETKPVSAFELLPSGGLRNTCRDCRQEQKNAAKRAARAARRETPEYQAELARKEREKAERLAEREAAAASAKAEELEAKETAWQAEREAELERRRKRLERQRGVRKRPMSPDKRREVAERVDAIIASLCGTHPTETITTEQGWDAAMSELQRLWLQSSGKVCRGCGSTVSPSRLRPPGPANFYTGKCNTCAADEYAANHRRVFGRDPSPPKLIPMKDGTAITIGEFARRVRQRETDRRLGRESNGFGTKI